MKIFSKLLVFFSLSLLVGCGDSNEKNFAVETIKENALVDYNQKPSPQKIEKKLIKQGRIQFETKAIDSTRKRVFEAIEQYSAYISSDESYKTDGKISNELVVRVPAEKFDSFLKTATKGVEKFDSKKIWVKDVTEEFIDVQARLKTKKELEQRYVSLLEKAATVTEILAIEKQIGLLRSEIESIEGRLNYLKNQVAFSTLTLNFYEKIPVDNEFAERFSNGFENGWDNLIWFFVFLINVWPFIIIPIFCWLLIRAYQKRKKKR
ncbi:MAG TPA: DUF4349 domain-containing protein [Flavobacteriaceae bacterium]|nr:DUF4349 domain-containing protein [Flavobacteriaceae bacterium]